MILEESARRAARRLEEAGSPTPRLDAEALLLHVIGCNRTWLYTWGDSTWGAWGESTQGSATGARWHRARFDALVAARAQGWPVAYLTDEREFWGLSLATSPGTLIPRPDTETLVEAALEHAAAPAGRLLDMGTGTGAVALAFASECPGWQVVGVDIRTEAVALARRNAAALGLGNARFIHSDWFEALEREAEPAFALIVANPPYIADNDPHLARGDVRFEPRSALVAGEAGYADLRFLVDRARDFLAPGGWLALEHGHTQAADVRAMLGRAGYARVASVRDLGGHERVSLGQHSAA
ncbi:peptide chain release factor N(5)-glutamine methyltransferase [Halomonas piscis]|uniref:Release factor glutamine methyltransferase n=1 Tax=Halomonas piscis TaxID=3031727 RepID=A0ABY9YWR4_9GAMM|nr:peptide chain release factor N(5)-glutamine methyltransferase [Halomonas piscis]WNK19319.1 peptide chain release factor N(5)-glutamine methyltransferase [Halomonas piscis]